MRPTKKIDFKQSLFIWGKDWSLKLVLLVGFFVNSNAQLHISDNTIFTVAENTIIHIKEKISKETIQNETSPTKIKTTVKRHKKSKKPLQPSMIREGTEPENEVSAFSFTSVPKVPLALYLSGKIRKEAIVNTTNFVKIPFKRSYKIFISFYLNESASHISTLPNDSLVLPRTQLKAKIITRPPPFSGLRNFLT